MKYAKQVEDAFARLNYHPRDGQVDAVNQIVESFLDEKHENVILCAPTGTGKSIIGAVAAEVLSSVKGLQDNSVKSSISLVSTNVLAKQYENTFEHVAKDKKHIMIKGAGNYKCSALSDCDVEETAESCAWYSMIKTPGFDDIIENNCEKCEYLQVKKQKNLVRHLTTNYSYFFIDRMYTGKFEDRDLLIWDEAHLLNELFSEHNAISFSQKKLQAIAQEIADTVRLTDLEVSKILISVAADCAKSGKINEKNYESYLNALLKVYRYAKEQGTIASEKALRSGEMARYSKLMRFTKKYEGLICKIDDLYKYDYDHVFEYKEEDRSVSVKPIFVGTMFEALKASKHNLFMSATVNDTFLVDTLKLDKQKTKFIKLQPKFPKENKEVIFFNTLSLSYSSLQNPETIKALRKNVLKIVKKHVDLEERGIILTPSFKLQGEIINEIYPLIKDGKIKLFEHRQGERLETVLDQFKKFKGSNAVLISPSLFEGIDLPGDISRYQILVKAPFPSLADKRIKFILDKYPDIYNFITLMKIVQGFGRSVRSKDDFAASYCLDQNAQRLFTSSRNIWKDEFSVKFSSFV